MKLQLPKKTTFWASVIITAVGLVVYVVHVVVTDLLKLGVVGYLQPIAMLLVVVAFVLLCLGLTVKGL